MRIGAGAAAGLLVTLALAACGTEGTKASLSATTSSSPISTGAAAPDTGTTTSGTTASGTTTSGAATSGAATSGATTSGAATGDSKPPRLAHTTGYRTYERCQGTCTGAVPAALRRSLKFPSGDGGPCPITLNAHPASPRELPAGVGFRRVNGSDWRIAEVTWTVPGSYAGPLLIRGEMLGGGALGFGTGAVPYDELQLLDAGQGAPRVAGQGRAWITYARIRSGGCYAYQVDGTSFSELVVFRAVA